jgi:hypothetical protein
MAEHEQTTQTDSELQNVQVDGAQILTDSGATTPEPSVPLTLESLFQLISTHHHQGSDGSEILQQGRIRTGLVTRSTGGSQTVTHDLGAIPRYVFIIAVASTATNGIFSIGRAVGTATGQYDVIFSDDTSSSFTSDRIVECRIAGGNSLVATITRLSTSEFDLSWTLAGALTIRYFWIVIS